MNTTASTNREGDGFNQVIVDHLPDFEEILVLGGGKSSHCEGWSMRERWTDRRKRYKGACRHVYLNPGPPWHSIEIEKTIGTTDTRS